MKIWTGLPGSDLRLKPFGGEEICSTCSAGQSVQHCKKGTVDGNAG